MEEVVICGCGFCWMEEEAIQEFVTQALPGGSLGVVRIHCDYPNPDDPIYVANPIEQNVRMAHYSITTQPYVVFDGVTIPVEGDLESAFLERLETPAILEIQVARQGNETEGTLSIVIIAEEEPDWTCPMMVWPILVESGIPGIGYWTYSVFDQAFRDNLLGYFGEQISFQGPYPDTALVYAPYLIDPSWDISNLYLSTIVQSSYQSYDDEVKNSAWQKFIDIPMGLSGSHSFESHLQLQVTPNPCGGELTINCNLPANTSGQLSIFDITGRVVHRTSASPLNTYEPAGEGVFIVTLSAPGFESATAKVSVIR